ncbi:hypothetical protein ASG92_19485 [Arthrobacter sp. Soil736]|uniref:hypothetical protein n=1 Tax=Arthrobacter sp. Soil736 TaxID=1736395 RepID=UPI000701456B|nr:hypothetical protein [Arthrobacter sp. Soil736]KRE64241.1 hypothetical protein ASG92_19485 [Arthrobacter sp. Soil736]
MNRVEKGVVNAALVAGLVGGGIYLAMGGSVGASSSNQTDSRFAAEAAKGGHQANGITEQQLTGTAAAKVRAAAIAANPGATVQRVETDAEGAAYEAHIIKADGSPATVKLNASFTVTATESGRGR